jgi:hypothetical protein
MQHLDPSEAAEVSHDDMPISQSVENSDPASALLENFLERRNAYIFDPDILLQAMSRTPRTDMRVHMEKETRQRMVQLVREIAREVPEPFVTVWQGNWYASERQILLKCSPEPRSRSSWPPMAMPKKDGGREVKEGGSKSGRSWSRGGQGPNHKRRFFRALTNECRFFRAMTVR